MSAVDEAVAALRAGKPVVLPTDTVYGLCADPYREAPARDLTRLKQRDELQPLSLLAAELDIALDALPELRGRAAAQARALLPGAYTLVFPNPAYRFRWLSGQKPDTIGIRVPRLPADARAVLDRVGAVAATSANLHGEANPVRLEDVPEEILAAVGAVLDAGELPGTPSTVLDLTGPEPLVLREGAGSADEALARLRALES